MERFQCDVDRSYHPHLNPLPSKGEEEDAENSDQRSESAANSQHSTSGISRSETRRVPARRPEAMRCCREKCCARLCVNWRHGLGTRYADANRTCRRRYIAKGPSVAMAKYIAARSDNWRSKASNWKEGRDARRSSRDRTTFAADDIRWRRSRDTFQCAP